MGECGCGNFWADFRFPGPGDATYTLRLYPSCRYCDTPAGIIINLHKTKAEAESWGVTNRMRELEFFSGEAFLPVLHPTALEELMRAFADGSMDEYELDGLITDGIEEAFVPAVRKTYGDFIKEIDKHRKKRRSK